MDTGRHHRTTARRRPRANPESCPACLARTSRRRADRVFRAQQAAAPRVRLGIMAMYLGAEKAGIRLRDYAGVPFEWAN